MPTRTLNDRALRGLRPPAAGRLELRDAIVRGLEFRLTSRGAASWRLLYRRDGTLVRMTLGDFPALSLAAARQQARQLLGTVAAGADPAAERRMRREAETVAALAERFLAEAVRPRLRRADEVERHFTKYILPEWSSRKARDIRRADVKALLAPIRARAPIMSNRVRATLSRFFNWAVAEDVLEASPATHLPTEEEHDRQRVLTATEIKKLWAACDALDEASERIISPFLAAFFRLRIVTAQRGGELLGMRWDEIDETGAWWTIPPERSKNGLAHRVPFSPQARAILDVLPRAGAFVFPGRKEGRPMAVYAKAWAAVAAAAKLEDVVSHDLRCTAASGMASLGVPRLVIGKVLNHVEPGITRVYDRHSYDAEKRDALERWGRHVEAILAGKRGAAEVVPLHGDRAETAEAGR